MLTSISGRVGSSDRLGGPAPGAASCGFTHKRSAGSAIQALSNIGWLQDMCLLCTRDVGAFRATAPCNMLLVNREKRSLERGGSKHNLNLCLRGSEPRTRKVALRPRTIVSEQKVPAETPSNTESFAVLTGLSTHEMASIPWDTAH